MTDEMISRCFGRLPVAAFDRVEEKMMYESPITRFAEDIMTDIVEREEGYLVESVHRVGFDIDKEELEKALRYDRDQYEKGFNDGRLAASPRWIPVKTRPMDEEEKRYWEEHYDYTFGEDYDGIMFDCPMPEDGQEVWVCSKCGNVWQDTCEVDVGIGLEDNGDWDDIVAWMPFKRPDPYKGEV